MADTLIDSSVDSNSEQSPRAADGPFWISTTTGAVIYQDSSGVSASVTTDSGATWGAAVTVDALTILGHSVVFERQIPGNTGTKVHVVWTSFNFQDFTFASFDINAGTWSTPVDITASAGSNPVCPVLCMTKANGFVAAYTDASGSPAAWKSADGASWSSISAPHEGTDADYVRPCYVDTGDNNDAGLLYWDISADELSVKMYDDSGDSWTETAIATAVDTALYHNFNQSVRLSDGHVIVAFWNAADQSTADLKVYDLNLNSIGSPTITAKTDVITDTAEAVGVGVFIDQTTDDIYVAYAIGATAASAINVFYKKSTDGGSTWGTQTAYGEDTDDDIRTVSGGAMGATQGGRFQPIFFNDDLSDIFVNLTNDIEIAAAGGGDPEGSLIRGKLIRGGLLRGGVLVG